LTRIIVNHLTRMDSPRICIAGFDAASGRHLRPVTDPGQPLTRALLAESDGPFELGAVVELGETKPRPERPEVEDVLFDPRKARRVGKVDADDYLKLLDDAGEDSLEDAFGPDLQRREWRYAVDAGEGRCSLGCVRAKRPPTLEVDKRFGEKLQLRLNDSDRPAYVPVNDLRFYQADHRTLRHDSIEDVQGRLRRGVAVWVTFGLARAFRASGDEVKRHWLQVNGLCLEDSPLGAAP
jgi:Dual OB-containing domain